MKRLVLILVLLLAVETYGVYGAAQVRKITHTCKLEVGPLCYAWEQNAIGKLLGPDGSKEVETALTKARKAWEEDVVEKLAEAKKAKGSIEKALDDAKDAAKKGIEKAKDAFDIK